VRLVRTRDLLAEAVKALGLRGIDSFAHQWFWDGHEHVDPLKEANAQATRLARHTTTLAHEYARQGKDWETELRQRAKEVALMKELGLPSPQTPRPDKEYNDDGADEQSQAA